MSTVPRVLKNFNLFIDGQSYLGKCSKLTLPELALKLEDLHPGGYDTAIQADLGMEPLTCQFSLYDYDTEIFGLFGLSTPGAVRLSARGALQRDGESATPIVVNMQGSLVKITTGDWEAGSLNEIDYEITLRYYAMNIGDRNAIEIDVINCIRKINGVDQLASMRQALGVA